MNLTDLARALDDGDDWRQHAPCAGQWFNTDPGDTRNVTTDRLVIAMMPGLALCRECPFRDRCLELVRPAESFYDGVCAGRVYRNGSCVYTAVWARDDEAVAA